MEAENRMEDKARMEDQESFGSWIKWMFQTFFLRLLGINLVFLICCVPVATIPAAMCGMHAVIQRFYRNQLASAVTSTFFREFLTSFVKRTVIFWTVALVPAALMLLTSSILSGAVWYALAGLLVVAALLVLSWFVPQLVLLNLTTGQALKNALILTLLEPRTNFALMVIHAVSLTVMIFGLPLTGFLLLILPVFLTVLTTGITMPVLQKYLVQTEDTL